MINNKAPTEIVSKAETIPLIVASRNISYGSAITSGDLSVANWPAGSILPEGSFNDVQAVLGDGKELRVALRPMVQGEPVLASKVSGFGGKATMSAVIDETKRAFSVRVNDVTGVAGFLMPGDRVDVLLTRVLSDSDRQNRVTDVVVQNVVVRGVDQESSEDKTKPQVVRSVTVEVSPEDSQKLALASEIGTLSLALRSTENVDAAKVRTVTIGDLSNSPIPVVSPSTMASTSPLDDLKKGIPAPRSVSIFHADKRTEVPY